MARTSGILQPDVNRAPYIAQGALCLLAAASVAGAVIGLGQRTDGMVMARRDAALEQAEADLLNTVSPSPQAALGPAPTLQMLLPQGSQPSFPGARPAPPLSTSPTPTAPAKPAKPRP